jgi:hypothetical protein
MVLAVEEVIEARLALENVVRGGFGGFFLQGQLHALMTSILST